MALMAILLTSTGVMAAALTTFTDVPEDHWAEAAVKWATDHNIVKGYTQDNTFRGDQPITRYENVQILSKYDELNKKEKEEIKDQMANMEKRIMEYNANNYDIFPIVDEKDVLPGAQVYQVCKSKLDRSRVYFTTAPLPDFEDKYYDSWGIQSNKIEVEECLLTTKEYFESRLTAHID